MRTLRARFVENARDWWPVWVTYGRALVGVLVVAVAFAAGCTAASGPRQRPYDTGEGRWVRVLSEGRPGGPVLVSVIGGGYFRSNRAVTPRLAERLPGWRVLQVSYGPGSVDAIESQVDRAFAWMATHSGWVAGGDLGRVVVAGESAGGQLAVRSVLKNPRWARNRVVSLAGTTELDRWAAAHVGEDVFDLVGAVSGCSDPGWSACATTRDASPRSHFRPGPRLTFVHSAGDHVVPADMGWLSARRYQGPASVRMVSGDHLDDRFLDGAASVLTGP